jgi:hypothetical protein
VDEKDLKAHVDAILEGIHPRMKSRIIEVQIKKELRKFLDELVREGRAKYDPMTDQYKVLREGEIPPPAPSLF